MRALDIFRLSLSLSYTHRPRYLTRTSHPPIFSCSSSSSPFFPFQSDVAVADLTYPSNSLSSRRNISHRGSRRPRQPHPTLYRPPVPRPPSHPPPPPPPLPLLISFNPIVKLCHCTVIRKSQIPDRDVHVTPQSAHRRECRCAPLPPDCPLLLPHLPHCGLCAFSPAGVCHGAEGYMTVNCLHVSVAFTILSFGGLQWWAATLLDGLQAEGLVRDPDDVRHVVELLLGSGVTIALLVNFVINAYVLAMLCLKSIFFVELYSSEIHRTVERLFNYIVYKAAFLPFVLTPSAFQVCLWSVWIVLLSSLKMFQTLAKDQMEQLNASPSATYGTYCRVFSALLFVLVGDLSWIWFCIIVCRAMDASMLVLLFPEPLSIAFETMQAVMVHGFQLLEMRKNQALESTAESLGGSPLSCKSAGGSLLEWKSKVVRNFGFILEILSLSMALSHYLMIWWFHGMTFHVIDTVLFLNSRNLVTAIIKRIRGFIKLRKALTALDVALPDATHEEIATFDDECAICREPMSRAKKLSCNHLFHLSCLRSWLDQGLSEAYSCPTCRRPLFSSNAGVNGNMHGVVPSAHHHSGQANLGLDQQRATANHQQNADSTWRASSSDDNWISSWRSSRLDGAGTSTIRPVSLGSMMRQLASSMSETYGRGAIEDGSWNLWPPHQPSGPSTASSHTAGNRSIGGVRFRSSTPTPNISDILAMAERVREILPHIPDELIIEDLQRTNNPTATVNNFLPT